MAALILVLHIDLTVAQEDTLPILMILESVENKQVILKTVQTLGAFHLNVFEGTSP